MPLPSDPAAFVRAAERGVNERDLDATVAVYATAGVLTSIADGAQEQASGTEELRRTWAAYLDGMEARRFWLRKTLVAADGDVVVSEWVGGFGPERGATGVERWTFDADGQVSDHAMWTFFDVRPSTSPVARARLALASPRMALALRRAQRRPGRS